MARLSSFLLNALAMGAVMAPSKPTRKHKSAPKKVGKEHRKHTHYENAMRKEHKRKIKERRARLGCRKGGMI